MKGIFARKCLPASLGLLLMLVPLAANGQTDLKEVHIVSSWGGLGTAAHSELTIQRKSNGYYVNGKRVNDQLLSNLAAALAEPPVPKLELANLGITQEWLDANAEPGVQEYAAAYFASAAPNQRELYFSAFRNLKFIEDRLYWLFRSGWTDDYPRVQITVKVMDGSVSTISSGVQSQLMLPWKLERDGSQLQTYNAHISRAIANLLPKNFANKERIAGDGLRQTMAKEVLNQIEDDWKRLGAENEVGPDIERLRSKYTVISTEINPYHNVDYGKEMVGGNSTESNLHAVLRQPDFPEGFFIKAVLRVREKKVENLDLFFNSIERYRRVVAQVPWLAVYLAAYPTVHIELRFVSDRSFSERAMRIFAEDMKRLGKVALAEEVAAVQRDVSLIMVGQRYAEGYWLILPDGKMVLWRFGANNGLLKWKVDEFVFKDCAEFQSKCVGAVISKEGMLSAQ